jgi:histidine triad (HIT) family protein
MPADCLFCAIAEGRIPSKVIAKNQDVTVFEDIQPQAPVHWLLIPNHHVASHGAVADDAIYAQLLAMAREITRQHQLDNYRLVINNGPEAGQSVFHLHLHLLAGRSFCWPPG